MTTPLTAAREAAEDDTGDASAELLEDDGLDQGLEIRLAKLDTIIANPFDNSGEHRVAGAEVVNGLLHRETMARRGCVTPIVPGCEYSLSSTRWQRAAGAGPTALHQSGCGRGQHSDQRPRQAGGADPHLQKEDFTILEDGKPQTIKYFTKETDLPLTIGLLVDVSGSQRNLIDIERSAASQFFREVLRKKDLAFLISFGEETELLQDYTGLAAAADRGAEPVAASSGRQRDPSGTGADHGRAARHGAVRRGLPGGEREAEGRGRAQSDRGDHRRRGPGQPADAEPGDRGGAEIRRGDLQHRLLRPERVWSDSASAAAAERANCAR